MFRFAYNRTGVVAGALILLITTMSASSQRVYAAYPGGNGLIAYSASTGDETSIHVMQSDRPGTRELTNNGRNDFYPSFSPDGTKIAFQSHNGGNADIYTVDQSGKETRLTFSKAPETFPSWSPNGKWIVFEKKLNGDTDIYAMEPVSNGTAVRLTTSRGQDIRPAWSPDGTKIAFMSDRDGDFEIYTLEIEPTTLTAGQISQLTSNDFDDGSPDWSPLGTEIVYASYGTLVRRPQLDIYVMSSNGSDPTQLTTYGGLDNAPDWSPDGTSILFISDREGNNEIFMMPVEDKTKPPTRLTYTAVDEQSPDWQTAGLLQGVL